MNAALELLASMLPENADAALISSKTNKRYFTGFASDDGYLLLTKSEAFLLTDFRYTEAAKKAAKGVQITEFKKLSETLGEMVKKLDIKHILLEGSGFTINEALRIEKMLEPAEVIKNQKLDEAINKLRIVKTSSEVEKIMKAQRITECALSEILPIIKEGAVERDLALELEYRIKKLGAEDISFDLITIAGANTSMPHGVPGDYKIKNGDFVTFDIGAVFDGYHSDMTRTFAIGSISQKQERVYKTVFEAQQKALDAVRAGVKAGDIDKTARDYIYQAGYEGCFGHSTGHGVGLDIHELPTVSSENDTVLQSGMVITVEPGIYIPGEFGVRIEDTVVVTSDGCINLCSLPKDLSSCTLV